MEDKIIPEAKKRSLLTGEDFTTAYVDIGVKMLQEEEDKKKRKVPSNVKKLRDKASKKPANTPKKKTEVSGDDIWNMSDEEFRKKFGG
jgi:hypothetical protein